MIIKFLQELKEQVTDKEFNEVLRVAEDDIKFNQIRFGKLTYTKTFIEICMSSLIVVQRCDNESFN